MDQEQEIRQDERPIINVYKNIERSQPSKTTNKKKSNCQTLSYKAPSIRNYQIFQLAIKENEAGLMSKAKARFHLKENNRFNIELSFSRSSQKIYSHKQLLLNQIDVYTQNLRKAEKRLVQKQQKLAQEVNEAVKQYMTEQCQEKRVIIQRIQQIISQKQKLLSQYDIFRIQKNLWEN